MKTILAEMNKDCTGCNACYNICPIDAIDIKVDELGFLYPFINHKKCIECGKCKEVCPKIHPIFSNSMSPTCFAAYAENDIRHDSSSGGIFTLLARWVLEKGGAVCGAEYKNTYAVHHCVIDSEADLYKLKKSKYVQSDTELVYRQIKACLKEGQEVLFVGTPCQVAGLSNYITNKDEKAHLFLVDILCAGVPSARMLKDYLEENFGLQNVEEVDFRPKDVEWKNSTLMHIFFTDGTSRYVGMSDSEYEQGFHRFLTKRESCANCEFCTYPRQGDISIGDYWGIDRYDERLNDKKGTSVVFVNNTKGTLMFKEIRTFLKKVEETPLDAARFNSVVAERHIHTGRKRFEYLYPRVGFTKAVRQCINEYHDVIVLGNITGYNFGTHLTHYALYRTLEDMGYTTAMLNVPLDSRIKASDRPMLFEKNPYPAWDWCKRYSSKMDMKEVSNHADVFITGSDQQFVSWMYNNDGRFVTQQFISSNKKKLTYAASLGHDFITSPESERAEISYYLKRFDAISVREDSAVDIFKNEFGVEVTRVLDPVFLMSNKYYQQLLDNSSVDRPKTPYVFTYTLDPSPKKESIIRYIADKYSMDAIAISDKGKGVEWGIHTVKNVSLETWVSFFFGADFVITDSFHGVCLCLIFKKQFVALVNSRRGATRFESLLKMLNLIDYAAYSEDDLAAMIEKRVDIDYEKVANILAREKEKSFTWLRSAIENRGKKSYEAYDVLGEKIDEIVKEQEKRFLLFQNEVVEPLASMLMGGYPELRKIESLPLYLLFLKKYSENYCVIFSVRDTPGFELSKEISQKISSLGFNTDLSEKHWHGYIGVINKGKCLFEQLYSPEEGGCIDLLVGNEQMRIESRGYICGNISKIEINKTEYSVNKRGLNIVVRDCKNHSLIDSVCFDTHVKGYTCSRA